MFIGTGVIIPSTGTTVVNKPTISTFHDGTTLYVGGNGTGNYTKIQDAINAAWYGDTIFVYDDSSPYFESVNLNKRIFLIGEDKNTTIIDAEHKGNVITIQSDGATVSGFTIQNCKRPVSYNFQYSVIVAIGRENLVIKNNIISIGHIEYNDYVAGIFLQNSSNNLIQNNVLFEDYPKGRSVGIMISDSVFNNISGNDISGDYSFGIEIWSLYEPDSCKDNIIYGNDIHHNMCGINNLGYNTTIINNTISHMNSQGISDDGDYTLISGNIITDNGDGSEFSCGIMLTGPLFGISSRYVSDNIISNNNPVGIWILENKNYISDNHISNNIQVGIYADYSYNNVITRNNFIDNPKNAFFTYGFRLFKNNKFDANYWSEYTGSGKLPKIIIGRRTGLIFLSHSWFDIDWHPAQEPYDNDIPAV